MKLILSIAALAALSVSDIQAQPAGPYTTGNLIGFTSGPATTNQLSVSLPIQEYDFIGFSATVNASAATSSTETFRFVQSYDGGLTYESAPSLVFTTGALSGTTPVTYGTNFFVPSSTHIKLYDFWNTNSVGSGIWFTNSARFVLKAKKLRANTQVNP